MMLNKIATKHLLWCKMVKNLGCNPSIVEDIVQDMYIKIHLLLEKGKDITYGDDDVNDFYIWLTLKSCYTDYLRKMKNFKTVEIDDDEDENNNYKELFLYEEADYEEQAGFDATYHKMMEVLNNLPLSDDYPYFKNIFIGYNTRNISMRKMAEETGINLNSIYSTLKRVMEIVRVECGEDVEDYFNRDFNLIK